MLLGTRPGGDDEEVTVAPVGDEGLRPVDHVVVAVADRRGADTGQVAARTGFGHRDTQHGVAADDPPRQPASPLLVGRQLREVWQYDIVLQREGDGLGGGTGARHLVDQDGVVPEVVDAGTTEPLGHGGEAQESVLARLDEEVAIPLPGVLPGGVHGGGDLFGHKASDRLAKVLVFEVVRE